MHSGQTATRLSDTNDRPVENKGLSLVASDTLPDMGTSVQGIAQSEAHVDRSLLSRILRRELPAILIVVDKTSGPETQSKEVLGAFHQPSSGGAFDRRTIFATGFQSPHGSQIDLGELVRMVKASSEVGGSVIVPVDRPEDISGAEEAIRCHCPGFPVKSVIIRGQAPESESEIKIEKDLVSAFGTVVIKVQDTLVEADKLLVREGPRYVLRHELHKVGERAKSEARRALCERLKPYSLVDYHHDFIPQEVIRVLDEQLAPFMQKENLSLVLKGGVAVAAILDRSRPVSKDIDFTLKISRDSFSEVERITREVISGPVQIKAKPGLEVHRVSTKLSGQSLLAGDPVDVDVVQVRRFDLRNFLFTFKYDTVTHSNRRLLRLPSGDTVFVCPPELSIMEKLFAARGHEQGKFDLFDCLGLLNSHRINPALIQRLIMRQEYNPRTDPQAGAEPIENSTFKCPQHLLSYATEVIGLKTPIVLEELLRAYMKSETAPNSHELPMRGETWKRLAFADRLFEGLEKLKEYFSVPDKMEQLHSEWSKERMSSAIEKLSAILKATVEFQIMRPEVYVRRTMKSFERFRGDLVAPEVLTENHS